MKMLHVGQQGLRWRQVAGFNPIGDMRSRSEKATADQTPLSPEVYKWAGGVCKVSRAKNLRAALGSEAVLALAVPGYRTPDDREDREARAFMQAAHAVGLDLLENFVGPVVAGLADLRRRCGAPLGQELPPFLESQGEVE